MRGGPSVWAEINAILRYLLCRFSPDESGVNLINDTFFGILGSIL